MSVQNLAGPGLAARKNLSYRISVDGGINDQTAAACARAGADTFVAGTSLFGAPNLKVAVNKMRQIVNENRPDRSESLKLTGESNSPYPKDSPSRVE